MKETFRTDHFIVFESDTEVNLFIITSSDKVYKKVKELKAILEKINEVPRKKER